MSSITHAKRINIHFLILHEINKRKSSLIKINWLKKMDFNWQEKEANLRVKRQTIQKKFLLSAKYLIFL